MSSSRLPRSAFASVVVSMTAIVATALPAFSVPASPVRVTHAAPAHRLGAHPEATLTAVVVKSWGSCRSKELIWADLNANWQIYGSIPISIDYSNSAVCGDSFTLADLEASGADVVILSDPAGYGNQFTADEVSAVQTYANEGHNVIGTYLTFAYPAWPIDNRALAPIFGLGISRFRDTAGTITPSYRLPHPGIPLFRNISNPYQSTGYNQSQYPSDGAWSTNELQGAKLVGRTSDALAAITVEKAGAYWAIYIATMPEYHGGSIDEQWFYNAIIFPAT